MPPYCDLCPIEIMKSSTISLLFFFPKLVPYKHNAVGQSATYKTLLSHEFESCWGFFFSCLNFFWSNIVRSETSKLVKVF